VTVNPVEINPSGSGDIARFIALIVRELCMIPEHIVCRCRNSAGLDPLGIEKRHELNAKEQFLRIVYPHKVPDGFRLVVEHQAAAVSHVEVKRDSFLGVRLPVLEVLKPDTAIHYGAIAIFIHVLLLTIIIVKF
jgi:hypothetical protein